MLSPELFLLLSVLVFGILFIVAMILLVVGIIHYSRRAGKTNLKAWSAHAKVLNLQMPNPDEFCLRGKHSDLEIELRSRSAIVSMYARQESFLFINCTANFPQPLNLLLRLKYPKDSSSNDLLLGQSDFDSSFNAACRNAKILQKLLLSNYIVGESTNLLGELFQATSYVETASYSPGLIKVNHEKTRPTLRVTDDAVFIEFRTEFHNDIKHIEQLLDVTTHLAKRFSIALQDIRLTQ